MIDSPISLGFEEYLIKHLAFGEGLVGETRFPRFWTFPMVPQSMSLFVIDTPTTATELTQRTLRDTSTVAITNLAVMTKMLLEGEVYLNVVGCSEEAVNKRLLTAILCEPTCCAC